MKGRKGCGKKMEDDEKNIEDMVLEIADEHSDLIKKDAIWECLVKAG